MSQSTLGWSALSSGIVTLVLSFLPGSDVWWGVALCLLGGALLYKRDSRGL